MSNEPPRPFGTVPGHEIRRLREEIGLSTADLGVALGLAYTNPDEKLRRDNANRTVRRWESDGAPPWAKLALLWLRHEHDDLEPLRQAVDAVADEVMRQGAEALGPAPDFDEEYVQEILATSRGLSEERFDKLHANDVRQGWGKEVAEAKRRYFARKPPAASR